MTARPHPEPSGARDPLLLDREPAVLVLEDGRTFRGDAYGAIGADRRRGGVLDRDDRLPGDAHRPELPPPGRRHDRAARRQHRHQRRGRRVGRIWVAGYVVRDPALRPSNWRSTRPLEDELRDQGVVGISELDTRALTRHLRERGAMRVGIFSGEE